MAMRRSCLYNSIVGKLKLGADYFYFNLLLGKKLGFKSRHAHQLVLPDRVIRSTALYYNMGVRAKLKSFTDLNDRNQLQGGTACVPDQTVESFVLCCFRMQVLAYNPCSLGSHNHCARGPQVHMKFDLVDR